MSPQPKPGILNITPYKAGSSQAKNVGEVLKLSSNESPFGASPKAIEAYNKTASQLHRYPDSSARALREAIGGVYGLNPERIVCGAGSDEIISLLCNAYAGEGDEVLYTEHGFLMYAISAMAAGATPVKARERNLTADVDYLLAAVTEKTKIVFLANPNNPTGTYLPESELQRLRRELPVHVLLVLDGAYAEYMDQEDYSAGESLVGASENTVMTRTFSKIYGLATLRLGWAYGPEGVVDILNRVRGPFNVSSPAIAAGVAAVEDIEFVALARVHNRESLQSIQQEFAAVEGVTCHQSYGNFYLLECTETEGKNADALNEYLLSEGIIVRQMHAYGLPQMLRITVGMAEDNAHILAAVKAFME
jgi:histidinol-phosphate aminotransferase